MRCLLAGLRVALFLLLLAPGGSWARKWTDDTGRFSVEAEFVELRNGQVHLRKSDGVAGTIPLRRLSEADRRYVQSLRPPHICDTSQLTFAKDPTRELPFVPLPEAVIFSPDGTRLLAVGSKGKETAEESVLMVWSTQNWTKEREVVLQDAAFQMAFTPDQKRLVLASGKDAKISLLDASDFRVQNVLSASGIVISLSIALDGKSLASVSSSDWKIQVWDLPNQKLRQTLPAPADQTTCIVYSHDGRVIASAGKQVRLWNSSTGALERNLTRNEDKFAAFFAAFSPDSAKLAASCNDGRIRIWDAASGKLLDSLEGTQPNVFSVRFSPDGRTLLTRSMAGANPSSDRLADALSLLGALAKGSDVCLWDLAQRRIRVDIGGAPCLPKPHTIAYSPDGTTIVATRNRSIGVWIGTRN